MNKRKEMKKKNLLSVEKKKDKDKGITLRENINH